jgi:molecular chaperone HtpG
MSVETHSFQAEVKQLLDLMIHSLYSHKEIFLRELISNASDALDRRRFEGLTDASLLSEDEPAIVLRVDASARTLSVEDNGIGMSREEVVQDIGTIARSGTAEFRKALEESRSSELSSEFIGQFGVGFYSSFMVADKATLITRKAGEPGGTRWESSGGGSFTIEEAEREHPGTSVILALKPADGEDGLADFADQWVLRSTVKKYSDFVAYPIRLVVEGREDDEKKDDEKKDEEKKDEEKKDASSDGDEPLNSMKAIWVRPPDEVGEDEYKEFYKHISHDFADPLLHVSTKIEGTFEARGLLYIPSRAPFDLYHREMAHRGIQLYVKRVFIMDECRDLMPEYLRFVKGVVDAEDLSLNVSREMLQQDRQIQAIRKHLVKKVLESLAELKQSDLEKYRSFFGEFGPVLKEGLLLWDEKRDRILDLVLCISTHSESELVSLADYVERMPEDQEAIYYLTGASRDVLAGSPHLEAFRAKGVEVILFTDAVDEVWLGQMPPEYAGKRFQSVGKGEVELGSDEDKKKAEEERQKDEDTYKQLITCLRNAVQDDVKEVRLSNRLTSSPACLVLEEGDVTPQMEAMLRQAGQEVPKTKRILELNPSHPLLTELNAICEKNGTDPRVSEYAELLYGQALLAEGGQLKDPAAFSKKLADLMLKAL